MVPRRIFWLSDLLVLLVAFIAAHALVPFIQPLFTPSSPFWFPSLEALSLPNLPQRSLPPLAELSWVFIAMIPGTIFFLEVLGCYRNLFEQSRVRIILGGLLAPTAGFGVITLVLFALKNLGWSRLFIFSFTWLTAFGLIAYRFLLRSYFVRRRAAGYYAKNVLLISSRSSVPLLVSYFKENLSPQEYRLLGYLSIPEAANGQDETYKAEMPECLGTVRELGTLLINRPIHEVVVIDPVSGGDWINQVITDCDYFSMTLRIVPEALLTVEQQYLMTLYHADSMRLPAVVLTSPHWNSEALFFKRVFDVVFSALLLIALSPVFLVIAVLIKLTTPNLSVFYKWRVVGRNGVEFTGYKFTSMISQSDALWRELVAQNEMSGPVFKIKNDPRITPLGRFLRKYSLNELPQLWSVLKGDMSLVGPRPAFRHELERYEFWHKRKLSISPGITCLWQIRGRNKISDFNDWVKMDLEYIDNWSLWLDFKILVRTAWVVIAGTGS